MTDWLSAAEIADRRLPGLPRSCAGVRGRARLEGWQQGDPYPTDPDGKWRRRTGGGGGIEFHVSLLPAKARALLAAAADDPERAVRTQRDGAWAAWEHLSEARRTEARERLAVIEEVEALVQAGELVDGAVAVAASRHRLGRRTVYRWRSGLRGVDRADWLAHLADQRTDAPATAEIDQAAWDYLRADWLRLEQPTLQSCYRRLQAVAANAGWHVPGYKAVARRIDREISVPVQVLARQGTEALKRLYPAQERDRSMFHALEAVNADGHKWDVFVRWPDGEIGRPVMAAFQDLYSGKILSWRIDRSENKETVRLAIGDMVERYGIPDHCWLDNGRAFASKWMTGGTATRYRFRIREEDPLGLLPQLGVHVHWTEPYHGQSKPIERAFRDFCDAIAKHPAFAGAYVGNTPLAKPENYGSRAVPIETFAAVVGDGIAEHNARTGRRSAMCGGVQSFDQVFKASYATAPIRRASEAQRRLWLLAAEGVRADSQTGEIRLAGNRYWSEQLLAVRGERVVVRFDPQRLHAAVWVERLDGRLVGQVACVERTGFADQGAAQQHARDRKSWQRTQAEALALERKLSIDEVALLQPRPAQEEMPPAKVVRPFRPRGAQGPGEQPRAADERMDAFARGVARMRRSQG